VEFVGDEMGARDTAAASEVGTLPPGLEFAIATQRLTNGTWVVAASGDVDLHTAPELERALAAGLAEGATQLVVDLSGAPFVDSTALHVLLRAARQLDCPTGGLIVVVPDANVRRVFEITGFDRRLSVVSSSADVSALP
jgi:anti-sigma B factor antagonist